MTDKVTAYMRGGIHDEGGSSDACTNANSLPSAVVCLGDPGPMPLTSEKGHVQKN